MRKKYLKIKLYTTIKMVQTKSQSTKNVLKAKDSKSKSKDQHNRHQKRERRNHSFFQ